MWDLVIGGNGSREGNVEVAEVSRTSSRRSASAAGMMFRMITYTTKMLSSTFKLVIYF